MCNYDCFKCPYPDCINDNITYKEMQDIDDFDKELVYEQADGYRKKLRKLRGYDRKYYLKNKDKILQKQRENAELHRKYNRNITKGMPRNKGREKEMNIGERKNRR